MKEHRSKNLYYREISQDDYDFIKLYLSNQKTTRFLPLGRPYSEKETLKWFSARIEHWKKHNFGTFILMKKTTDEKIGFCGLEHALGSEFIDIRYSLVESVWGKGYAFEAASNLIKYGFENLNLSVIYGAAVAENYPSVSILKKTGMEPDENFNVYKSGVSTFSIKKPPADSLKI